MKTEVKEFKSWELPLKPKLRNLTEDEEMKMRKHFIKYSFSTIIDSRGFIILGNGTDEGGRFYITEDDLNNLK